MSSRQWVQKQKDLLPKVSREKRGTVSNEVSREHSVLGHNQLRSPASTTIFGTRLSDWYLSTVRTVAGCFKSHQHESASQRWICSDVCTGCHTEIEVSDRSYHAYGRRPQYSEPSNPSTDHVTPSVV